MRTNLNIRKLRADLEREVSWFLFNTTGTNQPPLKFSLKRLVGALQEALRSLK